MFTIRQETDPETVLKKVNASLEGGHLEFENVAGQRSYAVDVYGNSATIGILL